ncbi:MAG: hypothetical protein L0Z62_43020 [Gemmataceae bacterium]|nr:hypothetical protein [Gemmataceae bacterium]
MLVDALAEHPERDDVMAHMLQTLHARREALDLDRGTIHALTAACVALRQGATGKLPETNGALAAVA